MIVVAGHGRHGTLGCAQVLIDPKYQAWLYPEESGHPRMFAVQSGSFRPDAPDGGRRQTSKVIDASIVAQG